jgi:hypothetical protein
VSKTMEPGETVALTLCPADTMTGREIFVSGLWGIEEFLPYEPANHVHEAGYVLARASAPFGVFVTADDLREQVDPDSHARQLVQEREFEYASEFPYDYHGGI